MAILLRMPEVSANLESAVIVAWTKAVGDRVAVGDCVAEIETDKAVIEFTADAEGTLGRILVPAGKEAAVGAPVAVLLQASEREADVDVLLQGQSGGGAAAPTPSAEVAAASPPIPASEMRTRIFASPLARRLAAEAGLPLQAVTGSGPHGRIVKRDVQAALAQRPRTAVAQPVPSSAGASTVPATAGPADTAIPHSVMRRTIARRLLESKTTIPHFYLRAECRMGALIALRETINAGAPRRISINDILVKAIASALAEKPAMNVSWTDEALIQHATADISVAVSTDTGLITPVVRRVTGKSVSVVSAEIAELADRARAGRLQPHEYQGGSFTVSNLGMYGVQEFSAIINPPQSAILAVGAVEQRAVVGADGRIEAAPMMTVTLSVDHRAIDGAVAAEWLGAFRRIVENPLVALI
ncbi:Dihydrolipoyllysine-residue succinyltransferase component of 2-oxoglutarate dehydrogenase complex OS=Castellaniella defragrans OX=75697 GN=HNR28_001137 PE=3 SV=1 [Castellaniella defragrans]